MRYLTSEDIRRHRDQAAQQSRTTFPRFYGKFDKAIDALLIIAYTFTFSDSTSPTSLQRVQSLAHKWLYLSVFTFHASLALAEQGFYTECLMLNRVLIEYLVSARYLADKPEDIDRLPMISTRVHKPLKIRERFEHVIPGYYDSFYKLSSEFTHPSHGSHIFKIQPDGAGNYSVDLGITFNAETMSHCLNQLAILLAGFLKAYPTKFKSCLRFRSTSDMDSIQDATKDLSELIYAHIALKGGENAWHTATKPLWDWSNEPLPCMKSPLLGAPSGSTFLWANLGFCVHSCD